VSQAPSHSPLLSQACLFGARLTPPLPLPQYLHYPCLLNTTSFSWIHLGEGGGGMRQLIWLRLPHRHSFWLFCYIHALLCACAWACPARLQVHSVLHDPSVNQYAANFAAALVAQPSTREAVVALIGQVRACVCVRTCGICNDA